MNISGSKNAALPILASCLLVDGECVIENIPRLNDVLTMCKILNELGVDTRWEDNNTLSLTVTSEENSVAPYERVKVMRASICTLGPLLGKRGHARVSFPGGCVLGPRPVDLHLKGLERLGAGIEVTHGFIEAKAKTLRGAEIFLGGDFGSSVLATANVLMASVLAEGTTVISSCACEPEIEDLCDFLNERGASIEGGGTHRIVVKGVKRLSGGRYRIINDRIEAGTFMIAAAISQGEIEIRGINPAHLDAVTDKLIMSGASVERFDSTMRVSMDRPPAPVDVTTFPYPGFPTDMQAQFTAYMSQSTGTSLITEKIYPERFIHIAELNRMGADIGKEGAKAVVNGVKQLSGAPVMASDLRAGAALVLAGIVAEGETRVQRIYHIDRGYENLVEKLQNLGADIQRAKD